MFPLPTHPGGAFLPSFFSGLFHRRRPACGSAGPGSPPMSPRCCSRLCPVEAEVRVAVRQGPAEKRKRTRRRGAATRRRRRRRAGVHSSIYTLDGQTECRPRAQRQEAVNLPLHTSSTAPGKWIILNAFLQIRQTQGSRQAALQPQIYP